jgi:protein phosphatase
MATTVVVAVFEEDQLTLTHVGDSRLYRLRGQILARLTEDHSLVQHMVQSGYLSAGEAQSSNYRNYVTRALGARAQVEFDVQQHPVQSGDRYLLCSDGLSNLIDDTEIASLVADTDADLENLARTLVALANQRGGPDNISVLLVDTL